MKIVKVISIWYFKEVINDSIDNGIISKFVIYLNYRIKYIEKVLGLILIFGRILKFIFLMLYLFVVDLKK